MSTTKPDAPTPTARLDFEPLTPAHAPALFPLLSDPTLFRFMPTDPPVSREALEARYARLAPRVSPDGSEQWLNWVAIERASREPIGLLEATVLPDGVALVAWFVFAPHQRLGYATEGTRAMLAHLRDCFGARQVLADIDSRNVASIRLVERLGFTRIAETKAADFFKGSPSDEFRYRIEFSPA